LATRARDRLSSLTPLLAFLLTWILSTAPSTAGTITAASCSAADVQAAINSALDRDQVLVPAGQCTWASSVSLVAGRSILLQGAGVDSTIITLSGGLNDYLRLGTTASRVTRIQWRLVTGDHIIYARGQGFRIDHNKFVNGVTPAVNRVAVYASGGTNIPHPTGLIDHNEFVSSRIYLQADLRLLANTIWHEPLLLGAAGDGTGVLYIEDNTFTYSTWLGNAIDEQYGGRFVVRHNTITNSLTEVHSVQGNDRGSRSWEIYNNTFNATVSVFVPMFIRAGTGVAFNNTIIGKYDYTMALDNVRSFQTMGTSGACNGQSDWDGNSPLGWPCRDQIGRSTDQFLWTTTTPYPPQVSQPAYFWGNTFRGLPTVPFVHNCTSGVKPNGSCVDIVEGRDYIADGSVKPGYSPFTYPHPLQLKNWDGLAAPTQLIVR